MAKPRYLAFDIGAESGRGFVGTLADGRLVVEEIYRFPNGPVTVQGTLYWDVLALHQHLLAGMREYAARFGPEVAGIGIDTWGVDFGLLAHDGSLLQNPVAYRDKRTAGMLDELAARMPLAEVYAHTGMGPSQIVTACQLLSLRIHQSPLLDAASKLLMMPDLLAYLLTDVPRCERTNAASTQLYDLQAGEWSREIVRALGVPERLLPELTDPGTLLGELRDDIKAAVGLRKAPVIAPCTHDTPSAVAAVPGEGEHWAFICTGTWSVVGALSDRVITSPEALDDGLVNELTLQEYFLCRNMTGLWLLQQARAGWAAAGTPYPYEDLVRLAEAAPPGRALIDPTDPLFLAPPDMLQAIREYCARTSQTPPNEPGEVTRAILESLALSYRQTLERLARILDREFRTIHLVGGGCRNSLLCRLTADATGLPVIAGPMEATVRGNLLVQAYALSALSSPAEIRQVVRQSTVLDTYEPRDTAYWDSRYTEYLRLSATLSS
ncbi:MAG: rhamnulokinase [Armatimonadota bacterium]